LRGSRSLCRRHVLVVRESARPPHDHRFVVSDPEGGRECRVEVFADGGRLQRRVVLDIGPVLHPDDLAADKTLALWGRARPRDFVDVVALLDRYGRDRLLELAAEKDAGFSVESFIDALRAIGRLGPGDWAEDGIIEQTADHVYRVVDDWRRELQGRRDA